MQSPRVLIVDDNPLNYRMAAFVLTADGFEVRPAGDVAEAMQQLAAFAPDLILMDIQLPDMDGLAATRALKADAATRHLPIVAFTAYAMKGDEARMRAAGCDGYIAKPIDVATFAQQVRGYLPGSG